MADDGEKQQLALIPPATEGDGQAPAAEPGKRGRGRPEGSGNKRTDGTVDAIGRLYGLPLEVLAKMWAEPARKKARRLKISLADAEVERRHAAIAGLPYMHQKLPLAIQTESRRTTLIFHVPEGGELPKQNQQLIDATAIRLDVGELDAMPVSAENEEKGE